MQKVKATVIQGHQVASGRSTEDRRFPGGTIKLQKPFFKERGLDLDAYFEDDYVSGTLNLSIEPKSFKIMSPEFNLQSVEWTDVLPAENFFLTQARIEHKGRSFKALIYIPDPATKVDHFKTMSIVEVIAQTIPELHYGDEVLLEYNPQAVWIG